MTKINPFKPFSPAPTGMFAGRTEEILELEKGLMQAKAGHGSNYLITGERGIGKSSLLMYLRHVSCGEIESLESGSFRFVTVGLVLSSHMSLISLIKLIDRLVARELGKVESIRKFLSETWEFVQRIKIMDSGIAASGTESDPDLLIDNLAYSLAETTKRITNPKKDEDARDGIVFLIDEADNAAPDLRLGYFFKVLTELLQQHDCNSIMFVVAGLPDVVEKLAESHESSVRAFNQRKIRELNVADRKYVIERGMEKGNEINDEQTTISDTAKQSISTLSEGYPHFIQQFAYSAFDFNSDGEISEEDVWASALKPGGAIDAIGERYYASAYRDQIKSDEYREVLTIMSEKLNDWVKKAEIREQFSGDDTTLTNALQALTSRKIVLKNPSKMGEYRLQQKGFALWIRLFGNRGK